MSTALSLESLRAQFRASGSPATVGAKGIASGWREFDACLPEVGMMPGVTELSSPHALGLSTAVAMATVRSVQQADETVECCWLDPDGTLHAPGALLAGVELSRLLVVRPPRSALLSLALEIVKSNAFPLVVVDWDRPLLGSEPLPEASGGKASFGATSRAPSRSAGGMERARSDVWVRKLSLSARAGEQVVLILTDLCTRRPLPLPVAQRLELTRDRSHLSLRIGKDSLGRVGSVRKVPLESYPGLYGEALRAG